MSDFVCPGPLAWRIADAREMLGVLADESFVRHAVGRSLRIAWCPNPEGLPVQPELARIVASAVGRMVELGHVVEETSLPLSGWEQVFSPLVLDEERREREPLLAQAREQLTEYELRTLEAAASVTDADVAVAIERHRAYRSHVQTLFDRYDVIATPATAVPAFPIEERPTQIGGREVGWLWGAFPFTPQFNVAGTPALSLHCGFVKGLPAGLQLAMAQGEDALLLDLAEDLEEALNVDRSRVIARWSELVLRASPAVP